MKFRSFFSVLLAGFLTILVPASSAFSAENIGRADRIKNNVTGHLGGKRTKIKIGTSVFRNQRIRTGRNSLAQLRFRDDTRLAVASNASIKLDEAVFSSGSKAKLILKATRGAFRFGSGTLRKKAYKIVTPSSTVGVRGTLLDIYVGRRGETIVMLLQGQLQACNHAGSCRIVKDPCGCVRIDRNGRITTARGLTRKILRGNSAQRVAPLLYFQRPLLTSIKAPQWLVRKCTDSDVHEGQDIEGAARGGQGVSQGGGRGGGSGGDDGEGEP